jgi:hypothetical protein
VVALRQFPLLNASLDGNNIIYHNEINIGIAVALENGLIVPVIRNADEKNVLGLQRAIVDLATRARSRQLKPDEVQGGTFSITNFGSFGSLIGTPIINQPQVAILGVGTVDKTPVVIDDAIAIRSICHLSLSFDHRLIDGALADQFMTKVKQVLEAGRKKCCKANLPQAEPKMLARWEKENSTARFAASRAGRPTYICTTAALRQRPHPPGHGVQQNPQGFHRQVEDHGGLRFALRARLGLPRPAHRNQSR